MNGFLGRLLVIIISACTYNGISKNNGLVIKNSNIPISINGLATLMDNICQSKFNFLISSMTLVKRCIVVVKVCGSVADFAYQKKPTH